MVIPSPRRKGNSRSLLQGLGSKYPGIQSYPGRMNRAGLKEAMRMGYYMCRDQLDPDSHLSSGIRIPKS